VLSGVNTLRLRRLRIVSSTMLCRVIVVLVAALAASAAAQCVQGTDQTVCTYDVPLSMHTFTTPVGGVVSLDLTCIGGSGGASDRALQDAHTAGDFFGEQVYGGVGLSASATFVTAPGLSYQARPPLRLNGSERDRSTSARAESM